MFQGKLIAYIILFESSAIVSFLGSSMPYSIVIYYIIHTIPSGIAAYISYMGLPKTKRDFKGSTFFFALSFCLGILGILVSLLLGYFLSRMMMKKADYKYEIVPTKLLLEFSEIKRLDFGEGEIKKIITTGNSNVQKKILAIQIISERLENLSYIHNFLKETDESRLYAFSLLSSRKKRHQEKINQLEDIFKKDNDAEKALEIAELYYEYLTSGLGTKALKNFYIEKALEFAMEAYSKLGEREDVLLLMGKIYKVAENKVKAYEFLQKAYKKMPNLRNAIELAEVYYELKEYKKVKKIFKELIKIVPYIKKSPIISVWINEKG